METLTKVLFFIVVIGVMFGVLLGIGYMSTKTNKMKAFTNDTELYCQDDTTFIKVKKSENWKLVNDMVFKDDKSFKISDCHIERKNP